jgi:hypothetical protein
MASMLHRFRVKEHAVNFIAAFIPITSTSSANLCVSIPWAAAFVTESRVTTKRDNFAIPLFPRTNLGLALVSMKVLENAFSQEISGS